MLKFHAYHFDGNYFMQPTIELGINHIQAKPLIIASSGGGGHIAAAEGIVEWMRSNPNEWLDSHYKDIKQNKNVNVCSEFTPEKYNAAQFTNHWYYFSKMLINFAIEIYSAPILGAIIKFLTDLINGPDLPKKDDYNKELEGLSSKVSSGETREYIDMLLDVYPAGQEFAAIFNALQNNDQTKEIRKTIKSQTVIDYIHYPYAYKKIFNMLIQAAIAGKPYTEIVSTQPQAIAALCDAVIDYNQYVEEQQVKLNEIERKLLEKTYSSDKQQLVQEKFRILKLIPIGIHQYFTDLPTTSADMPEGARHFMKPLQRLSVEQLKVITPHAVSPTLETTKILGCDRIMPYQPIKTESNPMVRADFKDYNNLKSYAQKNNPVNLTCQESIDYDICDVTTEINNGDKVYSIILGSLGGRASEQYIERIIACIQEYDGCQHHIYLFRSNNTTLEERVRNKKSPRNCHIHYLPYVNAKTIAEITTRSDYVVMRSGGLSTMEQMAIPLRDGKTYYTHAPDKIDNKPSTGLGWEDANAARLKEFIENKASLASASVYVTNVELFLESFQINNNHSNNELSEVNMMNFYI